MLHHKIWGEKKNGSKVTDALSVFMRLFFVGLGSELREFAFAKQMPTA
jgi:hypothetical protein